MAGQGHFSHQIFHYSQTGPYQQLLGLVVADHGNHLPISLHVVEGDPPRQASHSMTVAQAEVLVNQLQKAVMAAKAAGL